MPEPTPLPVLTSYGENIVAGEKAYVIRPPRAVTSATRLVLGFHGATGNERWGDPLVAGGGASFRYMAHVAAHDFVFVHSLWGGDLWGLEATDVFIDQAIAWSAAQGIDTTRIGMIGGSGGTFPMTNYWRRHRTKVGVMWLIVPGVHHEHIYDDNPTLRAQMDSQFGGDFKTNAAPYSPIGFASELAGPEPLVISWADDDTAVRDADIEAFAAAAGAEIQVNTATGGHSDIGDYDVDVRQIVAAFEELR